MNGLAQYHTVNQRTKPCYTSALFLPSISLMLREKALSGKKNLMISKFSSILDYGDIILNLDYGDIMLNLVLHLHD